MCGAWGSFCGAFLVALAVSCGGQSAGKDPLSGAGAGAGAGAGGAVGAGGTAGAGPAALLPQANAPSHLSDGRLPDIPDVPVGAPTRGWDRCSAELLSSREECLACPAAWGTEFLVAGAAPPGTPVDPDRPQFYFYSQQMERASAVWLDVAWLSGARSAELSLWETNLYCDPNGAARRFDLAPLLSGASGAWSSACIPLDETRDLVGFGFRIDAAGRVGIDSVRFGPACAKR